MRPVPPWPALPPSPTATFQTDAMVEKLAILELSADFAGCRQVSTLARSERRAFGPTARGGPGLTHPTPLSGPEFSKVAAAATAPPASCLGDRGEMLSF